MKRPSGVVTCAMHMTDGMLLSRHNTILGVWAKGCCELYEELGQYAELCEQLYQEGYAVHDDSPGVYDYEVSCGFGDWFGARVMETGNAPDKAEAEAELRKLSQQFWSQMP